MNFRLHATLTILLFYDIPILLNLRLRTVNHPSLQPPTVDIKLMKSLFISILAVLAV